MPTNILYIIGNGFDIHHGIKSRYAQFKEYLMEKQEKDLLEQLEKYFPSDSLWSDFEETLAYLDTDTIINDASTYLTSYNANDWSESAHHDYQYEINNILELVTVKLLAKFTEWILQLEIPSTPGDDKLTLDTNGTYLTFNYTPTLERTYRIGAGRIEYIHNKAVDRNSVLILGHSRDPEKIQTLNAGLYDDDRIDDMRVVHGNQMLDQYFADTYKPTVQILQDKANFFSSLNGIDEIHVLGHSLSSVDLPYFREIVNNIQVHQVKWKVTFFGKKELDHHIETMKSLGIPESQVSFHRMTEIYANQSELF
jgi:hypothetical protein